MAYDLQEFLGTPELRRLSGGHQSVVLEAVDDAGTSCVAKLRDADATDLKALRARMAAVAQLAVIDSRTCRPVPRFGRLVSEVWLENRKMLGTLFERATGRSVDHRRPEDARLMGSELAAFHASLSDLPPHPEIPLVSALVATAYDTSTSTLQLLHGDFSDQNLRNDAGRLRIFDLDDCGYGPRAFDVANSLYMVLFDCLIGDRNSDYQTFEEGFLAGYDSGPFAGPVARDELVAFLDLRVDALRTWLEDPAKAPVGIRIATPQWRGTLRSFVEAYGSDDRR